VLRDEEPFASALILSHEHQVRELTRYAPAAAQVAVVAGDPCYDRILASLPLRERYRAALGVDGRLLVVLSSTWSASSLLGSRPNLLRELIAELDRDRYAVAVAVHPNTTHGHGAGMIRRWYADCLRAGLLILPEFDGWRAGLIAADVVIGDHGSVSGYAAAVGRPTVLAAFDEVPPGTPISVLGELAPRLPATGPYEPHLLAALHEHDDQRFAAVTDLVTSRPRGSLAALRTVFYRLMDLPEPDTGVAVEAVPARAAAPGPAVVADLVFTQVEADERIVRLVRRPAEPQRRDAGGHDERDEDPHLCCSVDHPARALAANAAVLSGTEADAGHDAAGWSRSLLGRHPACRVVSISGASGGRLLFRRATDLVELTVESPGAPPEALASAVYAWWCGTGGLPADGARLRLELGPRTVELVVRHAWS
jgi:hypothetical protein